MKPKFIILLSMAILLATAGCGAVLVGTATGVGVYAYHKGELKRSYPETYVKTVDICLDTLKDLEINIESKTADGIKTEINAKQTDETPVILKVMNIAPKITEVSVRSGVVGVWDKKVSELIHATIAKRIET